MCIEVENSSTIAKIGEDLCIGCGLCVKRCPFHAIKIINIPKSLSKHITYRYGPNAFKLHRLPIPRAGKILGLVGTNGIGKSTALKILAGKLQPNFGEFEKPPVWKEILKKFRGSELQNYFVKLLEEKLISVIKPQYVDNIPNLVKGKVMDILKKYNEKNILDSVISELQIADILEKDISVLSGGELQRFIIATVCLRKADIYMFDEPTSYLDIKQRLKAARLITSLPSVTNYVILVEHDLSILDHMSDHVCVLFGEPSGYGVVTAPYSVREGINVFLAGFIPTENMRFREWEITFNINYSAGMDDEISKPSSDSKEEKASEEKKEPNDKEEKIKKAEEETKQISKKEVKKGEKKEEKEEEKKSFHTYPSMTKTLGDFNLTVTEGKFCNSEIVVLLGENGTGKTTLITMLAGKLKPDGDCIVPELFVSYKPQKISPKFEGTVGELLNKRISGVWQTPHFNSEVFKPMQIEHLLEHKVKTLSGGELQRLALILALGTPADIYLIDEPSAYLDSEQRLVTAKIIKRFIMNSKKSGFIVEHDFIMATYMADRVIVFEGTPGKACKASTTEPLVSGMNKFLKILDITFRRDPSNFRPRINKHNSVLDREQKESGNFFVQTE